MKAFELISLALQAQSSVSNPAWYLIAAATFALIPIAVGLLTSYVKISVVLGIIKNALGTQHAPSSMVCLALALALTGLTMNPIIRESIEISKGIDSQIVMQSPSIEMLSALKPLADPWIAFLQRNTGQKELKALQRAVNEPSQPKVHPQASEQGGQEDFLLLVPAFLLTELKEGFSMAFIVLLPFLAIDLIVSNILMGLGMMMVSPVLISLPLKLILFVLSDSWLLLAQGLIRSYQV